MYKHERFEGGLAHGEAHEAPEAHGVAAEYVYEDYTKRGGIINEKDYSSVVERADKQFDVSVAQRAQAESIFTYAHIAPDERVTKLYAILRSDVRPQEVEHHHSEMSDQRLFAEALRMVGDTESLKKLVEAYPNISFE